MAAPVQLDATGTRANVGQPVALFASHVDDVTNLNGQPYDVSRDGKRFLIATTTQEAGSAIVIVANRRANR